MNKVTKNIVWNLVGSLVYYFSQWVMTVLVVRITGDYAETGILALAMSVSLVFSMVSLYAVRNFQAADIEDKFENGAYIALRLLTCALSLVLLGVYLVICRYSFYSSMAIIGFMLIRITEALVDVFQAIFQKKWRMDIVGRSLTVRGVVGLAVFGAAEYLFGNLAIACTAAALSTAVIAVFMDILPCRRIAEIRIKFERKELINLLLCCTPLFLTNLMATVIPNFPKIIGTSMLGEELIGYYASVTTPAVVVQMIAGYCFTPLIPMLKAHFADKNKKILSVILKVQLLIIGVGIAAVIGFRILGDWLLELVFGAEILPYSYLLIPAVVVSILTGSVYFLFTLFTVVGRNKTLAAVQSVSVLIILALSWFALGKWELQGINYILIAAYSVFLVIGYTFIIRIIATHNKREM